MTSRVLRSAVFASVTLAGCADKGTNGSAAGTPLAQPQNLEASDSFEDRIELQWDAVDGAASYRVFRTMPEGDRNERVGDASLPSFTDTPLQPAQTYLYFVVATAPGRLDSDPSGMAVGHTVILVPLDKPAAPEATDGAMLSRIGVSWAAVPDAESYNLELAEAETGPWSLLATTTATAYVHDALSLGQHFFYRLIATAEGFLDSPPSDASEGSTSSQPAAFDSYFKASNTDPADAFGNDVALSADGNTMVVASLYECSTASGVNGDDHNNWLSMSGAVYVFFRYGYTWTQQAYIKASNPGEYDNFGSAVALSADGNTLAVGALGEASSSTGVDGEQLDDSAAGAGAAYVFVRTDTLWRQQAYIKASNTEAGDTFGSSIALSETGDTLAVGASFESGAATGIDGDQADNGASVAGAVYVFTRDSSTWSQQAYVKASNSGEGDIFGEAVALSGDGDTLAVGAWREASSATGIEGAQGSNSAPVAGAAYVFTREGSLWSQQAYLKASNTEAEDGFGFALTLSSDGDTLAVGAFGESSASVGVDGDQADNSASMSGAVYVFFRTGSAWSQQAYLKASNSGEDDYFGYSLSLTGTGDLLAVGAWMEDGSDHGINGPQNDGGWDYGAVYLFTREQGVWGQSAYVKAPSANGNDELGSEVCLSTDGSALAAAAIGEASAATGINGDWTDNSAMHAGAVYTYEVEVNP